MGLDTSGGARVKHTLDARHELLPFHQKLFQPIESIVALMKKFGGTNFKTKFRKHNVAVIGFFEFMKDTDVRSAMMSMLAVSLTTIYSKHGLKSMNLVQHPLECLREDGKASTLIGGFDFADAVCIIIMMLEDSYGCAHADETVSAAWRPLLFLQFPNQRKMMMQLMQRKFHNPSVTKTHKWGRVVNEQREGLKPEAFSLLLACLNEDGKVVVVKGSEENLDPHFHGFTIEEAANVLVTGCQHPYNKGVDGVEGYYYVKADNEKHKHPQLEGFFQHKDGMKKFLVRLMTKKYGIPTEEANAAVFPGEDAVKAARNLETRQWYAKFLRQGKFAALPRKTGQKKWARKDYTEHICNRILQWCGTNRDEAKADRKVYYEEVLAKWSDFKLPQRENCNVLEWDDISPIFGIGKKRQAANIVARNDERRFDFGTTVGLGRKFKGDRFTKTTEFFASNPLLCQSDLSLLAFCENDEVRAFCVQESEADIATTNNNCIL